MDGNFYASVLRLVQSYWTLSVSLAVVIGVFLVGTSLASLNRRRQEGGGWAVGLSGLLIGVAFVNLPWWINTWSVTLMGTHAAADPLAYSPPAGAVNAAAAKAIIAIIGAVGLFGVMKGLHLFRESVYDRHAFWPGVTHSLGGLFAINVTAVATMLIPFVPGPVQALLRLFV